MCNFLAVCSLNSHGGLVAIREAEPPISVLGLDGLMIVGAESFAALTEGFLSAALGAASWEAAMDAAARATGSVGGIMLPATPGALPNVPVSESLAATNETYFSDGWTARDERYRGVPMMMRRGVMTDFDIFEPEEIKRHPYYQEFLALEGLRWFAGVKVTAGDDVWCISIQRSIKQGPFAAEEVAKLAALSPRLSSAAAVAKALDFARIDAALAAFEASATGVILLDREGRVAAINGVAEGLLGPHLRIEGRRLVSWNREATAVLDRALDALARNMEGPPSELPVVLPRIHGRPLIAYPSRLPRITNDFFTSVSMVVIVRDLERKPFLPDAELRHIFKLTLSEARLAAKVGTGATVERAADELGIAYESARSIMKVVLQKTDTHRQAELVALLARLATARLPRT